jgi:hypothetical protein
LEIGLQENAQAGSWNKQKRRALALSVGIVFAFLACLVLRFVPRIDDALAGRPEYMRYVAEHVGASLAAQTNWQSPVIVAAEATGDCRKIRNTSVNNPEQIYFVVTYSESLHAFCVIEYAPASHLQEANAVTLDRSSGQNFGAPLFAAVEVVPTGHVFKVFPDFVLSMLDWRTDLKRSGKTVSFDPKTDVSSSVPLAVDVGLSLDLFEIRADVGRKHDHINRLLDGILAGLVLGILLAACGSWKAYQAFRRHCRNYDYDVTPGQYLREEPGSFLERAQHSHHAMRTELQVQARAENLARRAKEEVRQRLRWLVEGANEQQRKQIEVCLSGNDLAEMKALLETLESQGSERTPEERLGLLLESLKELCAEEEYQEHRLKAFEVLQRLGFRPAREFVVQLHDDLREAARKSEEELAAPYGPRSPVS